VNRSALQIYAKLLKDGQINSSSDGELFLEYRKEEVRSILYELEEELGFTLLDVGQTVYLIPGLENDILSYSMKDIREFISTNARLIDAYLETYIIMFMFYLFYGGKNNNPVQRSFIQMNVLIEELDKRFENYLSQGEIMESAEDNYGINFRKIAEYWTSKQAYEEGKIKTKEGTIIKACRQLEKDKLIRLVENNREIRPTDRLKDIFINYYLNEERVIQIQSFFAKGGI
jgi:hypothetical protein